MKTMLIIDDGVMRRLKEEAARTGRTLSKLVEAALRSMLDHGEDPAIQARLPIPTFRGGAPLVEVSDRDAVH